MAFLIALMSSRLMSARPMLRWPVMVPLNDVRGAENGAAIAVPSRARPTRLGDQLRGRREQPDRVDRPGGGAQRTRAAEQLARGRRRGRAPASSPRASGAASGSRRTGARSGWRRRPRRRSRGASSRRQTILPSSYPSMTHISHSGRDRSSGSAGEVGAEVGQLAVAARLRQGQPVHVPLDVEAARPAPRSGGPGPSGTRRSLRVNAGTSLTRRSISRLHRARRSTPSGMVLGSSTIRPHTCISWAGVSR